MENIQLISYDIGQPTASHDDLGICGRPRCIALSVKHWCDGVGNAQDPRHYALQCESLSP
jgi:hypothetical protein